MGQWDGTLLSKMQGDARSWWLVKQQLSAHAGEKEGKMFSGSVKMFSVHAAVQLTRFIISASAVERWDSPSDTVLPDWKQRFLLIQRLHNHFTVLDPH